MTIDKQAIHALADRVKNDRRFCADEHHHALADGVLALLAEIERLAAGRSKKERELEQELEVWRSGPSCWSCGDTGDVHDITGEWRGECDCLSAQMINSNRERDQLKAELSGLRTGYEAQNEVIAGLRKDAERYNWAISGVECVQVLSSVVICHDGYKDKINERVDAYMEVGNGDQ